MGEDRLILSSPPGTLFTYLVGWAILVVPAEDRDMTDYITIQIPTAYAASVASKAIPAGLDWDAILAAYFAGDLDSLPYTGGLYETRMASVLDAHKTGAALPPILIGSRGLDDGHHRIAAALWLGLPTITATVPAALAAKMSWV